MSKPFAVIGADFQLPSQGVPYDAATCALDGGDSVALQAWSVEDQRTLLGMAGADAYQTYSNLIKMSVVAPSTLKDQADKLLLSDVHAMLWMVRRMSLGPQYPLAMNCAACRKFTRIVTSLDEVAVKTPDDVEDGFKAEGLEFEYIDKKGETVKLVYHLATLGDEKAVRRVYNDMKRKDRIKNEDADKNLLRLSQQIDTVNDQPLIIEKKFALLTAMPLAEYDRFNQHMVDADTGIIPELYATCKCGYENMVMLEINADFFRSTESTPRR